MGNRLSDYDLVTKGLYISKDNLSIDLTPVKVGVNRVYSFRSEKYFVVPKSIRTILLFKFFGESNPASSAAFIWCEHIAPPNVYDQTLVR